MQVMLLAPGKSTHSKRFLRMLLDSGYEVIFVDSYDPMPEGAKSYFFIPYPRNWGLYKVGLRTINRFINWMQVMQLRRIWEKYKPEIVHVHWIDERANQCVQAGLHQLVLTCWGSDINNLFENENPDAVYKERTIRALSSADFITADTNQVLVRCETLVGKKLPGRLFYIGIDLDKFKPDLLSGDVNSFREKLKIPSKARVILSVRRLVPIMGHHHILRAFASVIAQTNENLVLLMHHYLDHDTLYEDKMRDLANSLGISKRIIWLSDISDAQMPYLYSLADLVINFPDYDGLPVSIFEAAACKKVVITNDLEAYREFLREGAFTVVSAGDSSQLATAIIEVLTTPQYFLDKQLDHNYQLIRRIADQRQCIRTIEQIYSELVINKANHVAI